MWDHVILETQRQTKTFGKNRLSYSQHRGSKFLWKNGTHWPNLMTYITEELNLKLYIYKCTLWWELQFCLLLCGCGPWSLTLREEHKLRVVKHTVLRKICGPNTKEQETGENCTVMSFMICAVHQILLGWTNQGWWDQWTNWHFLETREMHTEF
jgi:hypothetical protein